MQTILGAGGPIADELAREIHRSHTRDIRLVSRRPRQVNGSDELLAADLMDPGATDRAVAGSSIAFLTVGLPMDSALWEERFPVMMRNVIDACKTHSTRLVYFDNTYMYPGTPTPQTESTEFAAAGRKGRVRAQVAQMLLDEMTAGSIEAVICRAPEFYGPGKTKSWSNTLVFDRIKAGRRPFAPVSATTKRSLIWTPDAGRAMALVGNTDDAYGQTWHLPIDENRLTYREFADLASELTGSRIGLTVLPMWAFRLGSRFNSTLAEASELLPRYRGDNFFDSSKFTARFPEFAVTSYRAGVASILSENTDEQ